MNNISGNSINHSFFMCMSNLFKEQYLEGDKVLLKVYPVHSAFRKSQLGQIGITCKSLHGQSDRKKSA